MENKRKNKILIFTGVILLTLTLIFSLQPNKTTANVILTETKMDRFTKCLTEKNVRVYGTTIDSNSLAQRQMFGSSFDNLIFIDCAKEKEKCTEILIFPSWEINEKILHSAISLEALSKLTECEL